MKVKTTKEIDVTAEEIEQALAQWLSDEHPSSMADDASYVFNIRGSTLDKAYDSGQILDGCTVTIRE